MSTLLQDLRYGLRMLAKTPGFTAVVVLTLALGIGANSMVFSVFYALLLRALPFEDPASLAWIANGESANLSAQTVQVGNLLDFRAQSQSFSGVAGYSPFYGAGDIRLTGTGEPERLTGVPVTEDFFRLLGVKPQVGRFFTAEECRWGAPKTVVLSHGFWQRRFAADPHIIGRTITLDDTPVTVIGVLPKSFNFPAVFSPGSRADIFSPFPLSPETDRQGNTLALIGRLNPGTDLRTVQAEAILIAERIQSGPSQERRRNRFRPNISMLREHVSGRFRDPLFVLVGAVGFLMLLVCANLSNLLLARASARQKEMAIRSALGAGRWRLIRQMLIESITLSCCGAALGVALAVGGTGMLARLEGTSIPLLQGVRVDEAALAFTLLVAVLTGIVFGLTPALQASALAPLSALKESSRGSTQVGGRDWKLGSLVVCEIALACVLLTGAGLLTRSLIRVLDVELGFESENVLALRIDPGGGYSTHAQQVNYFDVVLRALRSAPGIEAVGLTDALPLGDNFGWRTWEASAKGEVYEHGRQSYPLVRMVDEGYLHAMRIPLRAGRGFTLADDTSSEPVIIVNETLARRLWPGKDPVGRILRTSNHERRVVGVVRGVRYFGPEQESGIEMYLPIRQTGDFRSVDLVVRGSRSAVELVPEVRAALRSVGPNLPVADFRTMRQLVDHSLFPRRSVLFLVAGFAGFGLILASLGIYGVISESVRRRRQEIGIRMALGAERGDVLRLVLIRGFKLTALGLGIGIVGGIALTRFLSNLLFGVRPIDPVTFALASILLTAMALMASYIPARRATKVDPMVALRYE